MTDNVPNISVSICQQELAKANGDNVKLREKIISLTAQVDILSQIMRAAMSGNKRVSLFSFHLKSSFGIIS